MTKNYDYTKNNIFYNTIIKNDYYPLELKFEDNVEIKITQHNLIIKDFDKDMRIIIKMSDFVKENLNIFFTNFVTDARSGLVNNLLINYEKECKLKIELIKNIMHFAFNRSSYVIDISA